MNPEEFIPWAFVIAGAGIGFFFIALGIDVLGTTNCIEDKENEKD